ncbi:hypothetical protein JKP88DRAFT_332619 [Tribonema minus]|uniref:Sugar phosphate phosphatase n=1 Tax=Tribonema minus TaxID=303371 RepID=A0A835YLK4_9STRA|nr:hypothetical protein JKP88DRAFT_332619 [Tribonema minus]
MSSEQKHFLQQERAPLPPIILSNVPGTWAYDTMSRRVRENILMRIYDENDMDSPQLAHAKAALDALVQELATPQTSLLTPIPDDGGPDVREWNESIMAPYLGAANWLDAPWLYTEFYVYRRVAAAFAFFATGYDPFDAQKRLGVTSALASMDALAARLLQSDAVRPAAATCLRTAASLPLTPPPLPRCACSADADVFAETLAQSAANLLADDGARVVAALLAARAAGGRRVDVVVDNAGFELFCDLCLADYLVACGAARTVVIQLKGHPTFVSDAQAKDLTWMVEHLRGLDTGKYPAAQAVGERWARRIASGEWELREDLFWAQPRPFWEMPQRLRDELGGGGSAMVFVKGDANYRRMLGDRTWDLATPFADVASYWPAPVCALRTLKAELGCGMSAELTKAAAAAHDDWMVSGRYGVVQLFDPDTEGQS